MEIIYTTTKDKSNFQYCGEIFKNKKVINGFNKMNETLCEMVAGNEFEVGDVKFKDTINGILYLDYPLSVVVKENITFSSLHELITCVRKAYREIYKDPNKYGIWGHGIRDLVIESLRLMEDNIVEVSIGS